MAAVAGPACVARRRPGTNEFTPCPRRQAPTSKTWQGAGRVRFHRRTRFLASGCGQARLRSVRTLRTIRCRVFPPATQRRALKEPLAASRHRLTSLPSNPYPRRPSATYGPWSRDHAELVNAGWPSQGVADTRAGSYRWSHGDDIAAEQRSDDAGVGPGRVPEFAGGHRDRGRGGAQSRLPADSTPLRSTATSDRSARACARRASTVTRCSSRPRSGSATTATNRHCAPGTKRSASWGSSISIC